MHLRLIIAVILFPGLAGWSDRDPSWPHSGPMPDDAIGVPTSHYVPIGAGTKSYRPIEPMPWGDVNKRVAPPEAAPKPPTPQAVPQSHDAH